MSATGRFKPGEGDWICDEQSCKNVNFAKRTKCNKCGEERKPGLEFKVAGNEIGKALAEKSRGLFSADDWMCKACGNVNWARRSTCNMCNAPKLGNTEPRTGYGGGYMERELNVQYKNRTDSDDEYDEFGRKKKKFRGSTSGGGLPQADKHAPAPDRGEEEEDDDEDDDDDDDVDVSKYNLESDEDDDDEEDLSKYNLSDVSDDDDKAKDKTAKATNNSKSRTSSRSSSSSSSTSSRSRSESRSHSSKYERHNRRSRSRSHSRSRSGSRHRSSRKRSKHHGRRSYSRSRSRSRSRERRRSWRSRSRD